MTTPHPVCELHSQFANHPLPSGERVTHVNSQDAIFHLAVSSRERSTNYFNFSFNPPRRPVSSRTLAFSLTLPVVGIVDAQSRSPTAFS